MTKVSIYVRSRLDWLGRKQFWLGFELEIRLAP